MGYIFCLMVGGCVGLMFSALLFANKEHRE